MRILKIAVLVIVGLVIVWIVLGVGLSWQFQKPGAIILIDVADYNIGGKERILDWFENNDELKSEFDFRAIITTNADLSSFNPFRFYDEIEEKLGAKNLIHATLPDMILGLYFSSVFFENKDIFSDRTEKNLIILSGRVDQSQELKDFKSDNPFIKIIITTLKEKTPKRIFIFERKSKNLAALLPKTFVLGSFFYPVILF